MKKEKRQEFGEWMKQKREAARLTQLGLAKRLGYQNAQIISNIERGVSALPAKKIPAFADALGCEPVELEFRVLSTSTRDLGSANASKLALRYLPLIVALDNATQGVRNSVLSHAADQLNLNGELENIKSSYSEEN